ncbi:MAG: hormogonium polysaccharide biosynthesis glycosyltransferase HpsE [Pegethrix bostrychoides GSE-TBD4-15B]|uniref:Hormogonium polysaccharide biosynthesis glycosyltransferase HpsE n=1 Tax=Pegethrix bostrychoides GSE-TBD4-15B TaxID=2839662 RepID=A0A951PBR8_9CYAN|nr:hormogonium polysaccharide biosynthesis glycosyltransferase HpsE [Pegethrix bostrychoides GSE-TBD4-15B]
MSYDFTVAIPTYNGARTLSQVLTRLQAQICSEETTWEVVVVDNNSTDETAEIIRSFQRNWRADVPLRYCHESRQGISYARQRAVAEAAGELIGFLDDDNFAASNWVAAACAFGKAHPRAGAIGGQVKSAYVAPPPPDLGRAERFLAISTYAKHAKLYEPERMRLPAGAGLVVRRTAWNESIPATLTRIRRGGNDYELSLHLHQHNWEIWYNPDMQIEHHIPAERLAKPYLIKLARLYGLCTCEVRLIIVPTWKKPTLLIKSLLGGGYRLLRHLLKHRQQAIQRLDLACETAFLSGCMLSPLLYLYRNCLSLLKTQISRQILEGQFCSGGLT